MENDHRAAIADELRKAWVRLDGDGQRFPGIDSIGALYKAFALLGADPDLLAIVGSFRDTLDDDLVLTLLREWNAGRPVIHQLQ